MKNITVLIDTNIFIDVLQDRIPFTDNSQAVIGLVTQKKIKGAVAAHSITNLWYILRKTHSDEERRNYLLSLFEIFDVVSIDKNRLVAALENSNFKDFEDCLQDECACAINADYIITRDAKDFESSMVKALTPEEFLENL
ncbi:MAG: PIN domain-containing protein [Spirochaetia bacterium]|nr:PIN domain-containing protein [Spirochaetia bacterium]